MYLVTAFYEEKNRFWPGATAKVFQFYIKCGKRPSIQEMKEQADIQTGSDCKVTYISATLAEGKGFKIVEI